MFLPRLPPSKIAKLKSSRVEREKTLNLDFDLDFNARSQFFTGPAPSSTNKILPPQGECHNNHLPFFHDNEATIFCFIVNMDKHAVSFYVLNAICQGKIFGLTAHYYKVKLLGL